MINRFKTAFSPIRIFRMNSSLLTLKNKWSDSYVDNLSKKYLQIFIEENIEDEKVESQKLESLQQLVLTYQITEFMKKRLLEFKSTRIYFAAFITKIITTFIVSWLLLALMNYAAYKIDSSTFVVQSKINFFQFFYYTFHSMFFSSVEIISPNSWVAMALNILGPLTGICISVFLITLYFGVKGERYKENIDEVLAFTDTMVVKVEAEMLSTFKCSIWEGLEYLKNNKKSLYSLFTKKETMPKDISTI
jgi:hypothetical protein